MCDSTNNRRSGNFPVKNNSREKFAVSFDPRNFLTVDDCNIDERLESSWRLVYYQVLGGPGIACCSRRSDIYLPREVWTCAQAYSLIIAA